MSLAGASQLIRTPFSGMTSTRTLRGQVSGTDVAVFVGVGVTLGVEVIVGVNVLVAVAATCCACAAGSTVTVTSLVVPSVSPLLSRDSTLYRYSPAAFAKRSV